MGIDDNVTLSGLPEDLLQSYRGERPAVHEVPQYLSGSHTGQLIHISPQDQSCSRKNCFQKRLKQLNIHHGHFINDHHIRL